VAPIHESELQAEEVAQSRWKSLDPTFARFRATILRPGQKRASQFSHVGARNSSRQLGRLLPKLGGVEWNRKEVTSMNRTRLTPLVTRMFLIVTLLLGIVAFSDETAQAQRWQRYDRYRGQINRGVSVYPRRYPRVYAGRGYWNNAWYGYGYGHGFGFGYGYGYGYGYPYQSYYFATSHVWEGEGFRDGLDDGKDDAKDGKANDPFRHKDYKNALTSAYIDGYLRGYEEGYRRYAVNE